MAKEKERYLPGMEFQPGFLVLCAIHYTFQVMCQIYGMTTVYSYL